MIITVIEWSTWWHRSIALFTLQNQINLLNKKTIEAIKQLFQSNPSVLELGTQLIHYISNHRFIPLHVKHNCGSHSCISSHHYAILLEPLNSDLKMEGQCHNFHPRARETTDELHTSLALLQTSWVPGERKVSQRHFQLIQEPFFGPVLPGT